MYMRLLDVIVLLGVVQLGFARCDFRGITKNEKLYDSHKSLLYARELACLNSFRCNPGANSTGEAGRRLER